MPTTRRPDLLFIFTDQQRADTLRCCGNPLVQTPNLDRLAEQGCLFENAYVTQPVCTPSRASIMTGLYPHTHGCIDNNDPLKPGTRTIAEMVPDDYLRAYYGKWHLGDEVVPQHGFTDWVSIEDYYRRHYSKGEYLAILSSYHRFLAASGFEPDLERFGARVFGRVTAAQLPEPYTKAHFVAREAARFITGHSHEPFILYVNFLEPHRPYYGPLDDLYPPEQLPVGPHFRKAPPDNAALINRLMAQHYTRGGFIDGEDLTTEAGCRKTRAKYLGNVTLVDRAVGDILAALDRSGRADETIVVYTSDHGDLMGDHGFFEKCVMYEEAVRVPLIIRVPWLESARRKVSSPMSQIDLAPTLLELLGQPIPSDLQGFSRVPLLAGEDNRPLPDQGDVIVEWNGAEWRPPRERPFPNGLPMEAWEAAKGPWRTIISPDRWKLNLSSTDQCELYDLNNDPNEEHNLYDSPAHAARQRDLAERIRRWQERTGDAMTLPQL